MITWDPTTEAENRRREIRIAVAMIDEATKTQDPVVVRRLNLVALRHLEHLAGPAEATA